MRSRVIAIIPARYAASRFPGKLLMTISGKSVIQRTFESAKACLLLDDVIIATDDARIAEHVRGFGGHAVMTSPTWPTGTDRIIEAVKSCPELGQADIIVNIQGDEPCIDPQSIAAIIQALQQNPDDVMATAATKITDPVEIVSPAVVKCVMSQDGYALYFSRAVIPASKSGSLSASSYFKHLGIYAFRRDFLLHYDTLPLSPLQMDEDLEQLKVLEAGFKIKVVYVKNTSPHVDVPEDIEKVTEWLCSQNTSL